MKIALIGCGGIARAHVDAIRRAGGGEVRIVTVSRTLEKARQAARDLNADESLAPYAAALESPDIDAVSILTPHNLHVDLTVEALRCGKHVLLEKPVARTVAEAEPIGRARREHPGLTVAINENFHFLPLFRKAAELVRQGAIGELQSIVLGAHYFVQPTSWRTRLEEMGGGNLIDGGVHVIHGLRLLGGEVETLFAAVPKAKFGAMEGEEMIQFALRFTSGATATVSYSWGRHGNPPIPDYTVLGTGGSLLIWIGKEYIELRQPDRDRPRRIRVIRPDQREDGPYRWGFLGSLTDFIESIRENRPPSMSLAEGLSDLAVVEAAYESNRTGRAVKVAPVPEWAR